MSAKFTYYGSMCVLIERFDGFKILIDPYINENPFTEKKASDFYDVNLILVTHHAWDHYGDCVEILKNSSATLVASTDVAFYVRQDPEVDASRVIATIYGDQRIFGQTIIRTMQAIHISRYDIGNLRLFGPPLGFVVMVEPGVVYYHSGDTSLYSDMKTIRELYKPNVMCIGISSAKPGGGREMVPREAAQATAWIDPDVVIPTHYVEGSRDLDDYLEAAKIMAPAALVRAEIEKPFVYTPFSVQ